tara:strand:+ start:44 stop:310 length:267 start_codon:yes stop_codon:yes gene_type:complete
MSVKEIKDNLEKGNVIIGLKETLKNMRKNKVSKIFICNNCLASAKLDLENYSKISGIKLDVLNKSSEDLGVLCKKPHSISVLGILKND